MLTINTLTLQAADPSSAAVFYRDALGLDGQVRVRASDEPTSGFRGFTVSLLVAQPATAAAFIDAALQAGAESLKPAGKSMWGFGGVVRAPDGSIWKVATSNKKDTGPATREIDDVVLLLGADDVAASKRFYAERGLEVGKSFLNRYVEFKMPSSPIKLALYGRRALAKDAGVSPEGSGSHRLVVDGDLGSCADPDGFTWASAGDRAPQPSPA